MAGWLLLNEEDEISAYGPRNWVKPEEMAKGMDAEGYIYRCIYTYIYMYDVRRWKMKFKWISGGKTGYDLEHCRTGREQRS